ncbi:MAG: hypothetical protein IJ489_11950 [Clostridia bacterium]|nr:hypothetical protein [Clostridia bacterium]
MKRILALFMILAMMIALVACTNNDADETTTTDSSATETTDTTGKTFTETASNEGTFKAGVYTATSSYASGEMNMTWNFVLTLKEDGTFVLTNGTDEKGAGTYALTDDCYTMTYNDERSCTFAVQADGTLILTADFPFGMATIQRALVGDIVFTYAGEVSAEGGNEGEQGGESDDTVYTIAAGTYEATYTKESPMAGTVVYNYTATIGEDGSFSYAVTFAMGDQVMDGSSANGTYTIDGNKFTFTDSEGNVTEGTLTANNTLTIALKASAMASAPYEVTFTAPSVSIMAGTYSAYYEKVSAMAGTVLYEYTAVVGADGAFSYSVKFMMGETEMDGSSANGTYTVEGDIFTFTDSEGNVTEGTLVAENTLKISLKASAMAKEPYEVVFTISG